MGDILNEYLQTSLNPDGTLKASAVTEGKIPGTIARDSDVSSAINTHNTDAGAHPDIRELIGTTGASTSVYTVSSFLNGDLTAEDMISNVG